MRRGGVVIRQRSESELVEAFATGLRQHSDPAAESFGAQPYSASGVATDTRTAEISFSSAPTVSNASL